MKGIDKLNAFVLDVRYRTPLVKPIGGNAPDDHPHIHTLSGVLF